MLVHILWTLLSELVSSYRHTTLSGSIGLFNTNTTLGSLLGRKVCMDRQCREATQKIKNYCTYHLSGDLSTHVVGQVA